MTINELLINIKKDMLDQLKKELSIKSLRGMRFDLESPPDYTMPLSQQIYLLRYLYAYSFEYFLVFYKMFNASDGEIKKAFNILSIGCGSAVDYWAFKRAVNYMELTEEIEIVCYNGIDIVSWLYSFPKEKYDLVNIHQQDFISWLRENTDIFSKSDIIFFPKSIGEFSDEYFSDLLNELTKDNCKISRKSVAVIGSFRKRKHAFDVARFDQIVNCLKSSANYRVWKSVTKSPQSARSCQKIPNLFGYFEDYPANLREELRNICKYCNEFNRNGDHCDNPNCLDPTINVNKYPITTKDYIDFKIVILKKR